MHDIWINTKLRVKELFRLSEQLTINNLDETSSWKIDVYINKHHKQSKRRNRRMQAKIEVLEVTKIEKWDRVELH